VTQMPTPPTSMVRSADERIWKRWLELLGRAQSLGLKVKTVTLPIDRALLGDLNHGLIDRIDARVVELAQADAERARQAGVRRLEEGSL
jgi:hypothetical protein